MHGFAVPVQAPLHPVKAESADGIAVSAKDVGNTNCAEHVAPHDMPARDDVTMPLPVPVLLTLRVLLVGAVNASTPVIVAAGAEMFTKLKFVALPL